MKDNETAKQYSDTALDLLSYTEGNKYNTIYADPPWQFQNRTGKVAPEHKRLNRYSTMTLQEIKDLPIPEISGDKAHLYLWCPNALLPEGLEVMKAWGFEYKGNIVWEKVRKDGMPDGRGVRDGWAMWGNQADKSYEPDWNTYKNHTKAPEHTEAPLE